MVREKEETLKGSHLLLAIGRVPNSAELNLEAAGVKTGKHGIISVNEYLETNVPVFTLWGMSMVSSFYSYLL